MHQRKHERLATPIPPPEESTYNNSEKTYLATVAEELNDRPRKTLDWYKPSEKTSNYQHKTNSCNHNWKPPEASNGLTIILTPVEPIRGKKYVEVSQHLPRFGGNQVTVTGVSPG